MSVWPEEDIRDLRVLWASGLPTAEIGERLGYSKSAICGKADRLNLERRPSPIVTGGNAAIAALRPSAKPKTTLPALASVAQPSAIALFQTLATIPAPPVFLSTEDRDQRILLMVDLTHVECARALGISRYIVRYVRAKKRRAEFKIVPTDVFTERPDPPKPVIVAPPPVLVRVQPRRLPTLSCCWPTGTRTSALNTYSSCGDHAVPGKPYCVEHDRLAHQPRRSAAEAVAAE